MGIPLGPKYMLLSYMGPFGLCFWPLFGKPQRIVVDSEHGDSAKSFVSLTRLWLVSALNPKPLLVITVPRYRRACKSKNRDSFPASWLQGGGLGFRV